MWRVSEVNTEERERVFDKTKRLFVGATALIAVGLAVAGTYDRAAGGVLLLAGWVAGVMGLHRMGRAGSAPRDPS
jgi:hypothetical protein